MHNFANNNNFDMINSHLGEIKCYSNILSCSLLYLLTTDLLVDSKLYNYIVDDLDSG